MDAIIEVKDYVKIIKDQVILDNINLEIYPGKIYGFIGHNGSGKSMLFKAICGFITPTKGCVRVNKQTIGVDLDFPKDVGIIIETPHFISDFNAFGNLKLLASIRKEITDADICNVIRQVGLDPNSKKKVKAFSLGMKQRLALAQAIMEDPEILILDEPMNALDKDGVTFCRELLLEKREQGKTILICSHMSEDIRVLCDHVWRLDNGKIENIQ